MTPKPVGEVIEIVVPRPWWKFWQGRSSYGRYVVTGAEYDGRVTRLALEDEDSLVFRNTLGG